MKKFVSVFAPIAVIVLSTTWTVWKILSQRPARPLGVLSEQSQADGYGHARGIVQVDLMRHLIAEQACLIAPQSNESGTVSKHRLPTQNHPLLDHEAPRFVLKGAGGRTWKLEESVSDGPVVVVFYLGSTCMACMTHLVELDVASSRFRERGARVLAISGDSPRFSMERMRRFGELQIPLLSDPDHAVSAAYGVWKALPSGEADDGEAFHGTFLVDRNGIVRWAYVGNRPFTDIGALLDELSWVQTVTRSDSLSDVR